MEIAIINEDLFKANSPVKDDTIITKFVPYIIIAQKMYIERILGRALLEQLQNDIKNAATTSIPAHSQALIIEVAPALSFYAVYQGLPFHWAAIVNKGVTVRESENSGGISFNDIGALRRGLKDDAEYMATRLVKYLCGCKTNYPLWMPAEGCGCGCDDNTGSKNIPLDAGIFIPKRRR